MWEQYTKKAPIEVKGGIKAQTVKGQFGGNWWSKRWIAALESFHDSARLQRGRNYARRGQVISIDIKEGSVFSKVQGSRKNPYSVEIEFETFSSSIWRQIIDMLSSQAIYVAKLLAGSMPDDIEEIFKHATFSLLPRSHDELQTDCSCPDWSNPCKHVAAVYYLLGEEFDRDPFLIFKLRGMDQKNFIHLLENQSIPTLEQTKRVEESRASSLPSDPSAFWHHEKISNSYNAGEIKSPSQDGALVKGLGKFSFWRWKKSIENILIPIYQETSKMVLDILTNDL